MGDVVDRIVLGAEMFDAAGRARCLHRTPEEYFPREAEAIDRYVELVLHVQRASQTFFAERALPGAMGMLLGPLDAPAASSAGRAAPPARCSRS